MDNICQYPLGIWEQSERSLGKMVFERQVSQVDIAIQQAPMATSSVPSSLAAGNAEWDLSVHGCEERPSWKGEEYR